MPEIYQDPSRPIDQRARDLLGRMTLEEKAAQMHALWLLLSEDGEHRPRQDDFTGGTDPAAVKEAMLPASVMPSSRIWPFLSSR